MFNLLLKYNILQYTSYVLIWCITYAFLYIYQKMMKSVYHLMDFHKWTYPARTNIKKEKTLPSPQKRPSCPPQVIAWKSYEHHSCQQRGWVMLLYRNEVMRLEFSGFPQRLLLRQEHSSPHSGLGLPNCDPLSTRCNKAGGSHVTEGKERGRDGGATEIQSGWVHIRRYPGG